MPNWMRLLIVGLLAIGSAFGLLGGHRAASDQVSSADLPYEARQALLLIKKGGPFPYARDGTTFGNFEKRLPAQPRGYYHEYTVKTPWQNDRGPRRIISGQGGEFYYTDDHYQTFRRITE